MQRMCSWTCDDVLLLLVAVAVARATSSAPTRLPWIPPGGGRQFFENEGWFIEDVGSGYVAVNFLSEEMLYFPRGG
jgi:hypothetical protein